MRKRTLKTGNAHLAVAAAAELRQVHLADALSLVLLIRDDDPLRYECAAVRYAARIAAQVGRGAGSRRPAKTPPLQDIPN